MQRPRYAPGPGGPQVGLPIPAPYGQPPQGYGAMPGYPGPGGPGARGPPVGVPPQRAPNGRGPPSPTNPNMPIPRATGAPPPNGAPRAGGAAPAGVPQSRPAPAGAPAPGARPAGQPQAQAYPKTTVRGPGGSDLGAALANANPMEQKQLLGEVIYMKIAPYVSSTQIY